MHLYKYDSHKFMDKGSYYDLKNAGKEVRLRVRFSVGYCWQMPGPCSIINFVPTRHSSRRLDYYSIDRDFFLIPQYLISFYM